MPAPQSSLSTQAGEEPFYPPAQYSPAQLAGKAAVALSVFLQCDTLSVPQP